MEQTLLARILTIGVVVAAPSLGIGMATEGQANTADGVVQTGVYSACIVAGHLDIVERTIKEGQTIGIGTEGIDEVL